MVSRVWSLSCVLFYSQCSRAQSFCKSSATCPVPMELAPFPWDSFTPKSIIKQPLNLNSQCHRDYFPSVCVQLCTGDTVNLVL